MAYFEVYKLSKNFFLITLKKLFICFIQVWFFQQKYLFTAVSLIHGSIYLQRYYKTRVVWPAGVFALLRFINYFYYID